MQTLLLFLNTPATSLTSIGLVMEMPSCQFLVIMRSCSMILALDSNKQVELHNIKMKNGILLHANLVGLFKESSHLQLMELILMVSIEAKAELYLRQEMIGVLLIYTEIQMKRDLNAKVLELTVVTL